MSSVLSIITIPMGYSNSYLIISGGRGILVDGGTSEKIKNVQIALKKNKLTFSDIILIVFTHTHADHVGSLAEIKEKSGARILVHSTEREYLKRGITPFPRGTMWFSKIILGIGRTPKISESKYPPVNPEMKDSYEKIQASYL